MGQPGKSLYDGGSSLPAATTARALLAGDVHPRRSGLMPPTELPLSRRLRSDARRRRSRRSSSFELCFPFTKKSRLEPAASAISGRLTGCSGTLANGPFKKAFRLNVRGPMPFSGSDCHDSAQLHDDGNAGSDGGRSAQAQDGLSGYDRVRKLALGGEGGWDFLEVDSSTQKLFVARGTHVVVVDLESEKVVGEIADTPGVHGIAFVADLGRGFTSNGGDASVTAFDTRTLRTLGKIKAEGRPDIIYFEPVSRRVFTMNHGTNNCTAIDPDEMKVVGTLALGGVPELAVSDEKGHIFVNLEDKSEIVEFDANSEDPQSLPAGARRGADRSGFRRCAKAALQHVREPEAGGDGCEQRQGCPDAGDRAGARRLRVRPRKEADLQLKRRRWHGLRDPPGIAGPI